MERKLKLDATSRTFNPYFIMKNKEDTFIQVWDYILDNNELDVSDVLLMSKVLSLHETEEGCYMTNEYICTMLRLKNVETSSRRINKLEKMGYVELKYIPLPTNVKKTRRYIIPTYKNGLTLRSSRVDLKVNTPLTTKSIPIDLKVNTPMTLKSIPPCLESQSITSVDNINDNIKKTNQVYNTNLEYQDNPSVEDKLKVKGELGIKLKSIFKTIPNIIKLVDINDLDKIERMDKIRFDLHKPTIEEYQSIKIN